MFNLATEARAAMNVASSELATLMSPSKVQLSVNLRRLEPMPKERVGGAQQAVEFHGSCINAKVTNL